MLRKIDKECIYTISILILSFLIFKLSDIDIWFSLKFYSRSDGWIYGNLLIFDILYNYGNIPGLLLGLISFIIFFLGLFFKRFIRYRKITIFLILMLIIVPGILVPTIKDLYGRPRPIQISKFGGKYEYVSIFKGSDPKRGRSFPSGHAAIGFYLISPFFFLRYTSKRHAIFVLFIGLLYGIIIGIARIAQGGHFLSDIVFSGLILYSIGLILSKIFKFHIQVYV